ncbi:MAG: signal transduction histidine kinase [Granulosicoccus sp.]|jgi:signal transduction histidine kinase
MRRLGISLLVVVVISIIGAGWIIDRLFSRLKAPDNTIAAAQVIGSQLAAQLDHSAQELVSLAATSATVGFDLTLIDRDDIAIPESLQPVLNSSAPLILESEKGISLYFLLPNTHRVLSVDLPRVVETRLRLILTLLFYTAVVFLLLLWLYPLVRRLHRLATAAKQFGEGELYQRISTHSRSQLYDIESEFNRMAQRIQDLVGDNKLLSSAVSHDLRTPLARLRFGVDALSEQVSEPIQEDYILRISHDLTLMEELVEVLLEFAQLDQRLNQMPLEQVSLIELLEECVQGCQTGTRHRVNLNVSCVEVQLLAEPRYLKMMFNNVLNNAVKFALSEIQITVDSNRKFVRVCVEDDGPGFEGADPERLIKPFEKGLNLPSDSVTRGHGIGLAIVHRIALWHDVSLIMSDGDSLGGATVRMNFPLTP